MDATLIAGSVGREGGGQIMRHDRWHAVGDLPGARIVRRFTGRCFEFVDEHDGRLATLDDDLLTTASGSYAFSQAGVERVPSREVVIAWPRRPRAREILKKGPAPYQIDMASGPALGFWIRSDLWSLTWNVGELVNADAGTLITLRWTPDSHRLLHNFRSGKRQELKRLGEAVISPDVTLPAEPVLLITYAFQLFDGLSTGGG